MIKTPDYFIFVFLILMLQVSAIADQAVNHANGNFSMGVTDFGTLAGLGQTGIADNFEYPKESGKKYLNQYSEIWIGNPSGTANSWSPTGAPIDNWRTTENGGITATAKPSGLQISTAQFDDQRIEGFPLGVLVDQTTYSWPSQNFPDHDDFIIYQLTVTNGGAVDLENVFMAFSTNWNVDGEDLVARPQSKTREEWEGTISRDWADWDEASRMLFTYDGDPTDELEPVHIGTALIDGKLATHQIYTFYSPKTLKMNTALFNDGARLTFMSDQSFLAPRGLGGGSKAELDALGFPPWDYISILSAGPYNIRAGNSVNVSFAIVAGESYDHLIQNVKNAYEITYTPSEITAKVVKNAVEISWEKPINTVGGYQLFRKVEGETDFTQIGPHVIEGVTIPDGEVTFGLEHTYKVSPVDLDGNPLNFFTEEVTVLPDFIPDPPTAFTGEIDLAKLQIVIALPTHPQPIHNYIIFRNHTGEEPWTQIAKISADQTTFVDENIFPGYRYFYAISATNKSGDAGDLSEPTTAFDLPATPEKQIFTDLEKLNVFPNPFLIGKDLVVNFENLPKKATISIFDGTGNLIKILRHDAGHPDQLWDGKNENGDPVATGVYIYQVTSLSAIGVEMIVETGKILVRR